MYQKTEQEIMENWKGDISNPIVSICSITYNHEKYIEEALDSFLMQETNFPFEIVIDDDCSPDNTEAIIRQYKKKFPTIINENIRKKNVGSMHNFIENMKRARGKYIALCEGDDYWTDPLKLQKQVDFLNKNIEYVCCFHGSKVVNKEGLVINSSLLGNPRDYNEIELLSTAAFITVHSVMFRNIIEYSNMLKDMPFGDMALWHLLGFHGKAKYLKNIKKAVYRVHDGGIWSSLDKYDKYEKTVFSKKVIKQNLISKSINTTMINIIIKKYILQKVNSTLSNKDFDLYRKIVLNIWKDSDYTFSEFLSLTLKPLVQKINKKFKGIFNVRNK